MWCNMTFSFLYIFFCFFLELLSPYINFLICLYVLIMNIHSWTFQKNSKIPLVYIYHETKSVSCILRFLEDLSPGALQPHAHSALQACCSFCPGTSLPYRPRNSLCSFLCGISCFLDGHISLSWFISLFWKNNSIQIASFFFFLKSAWLRYNWLTKL